MTDTGPKDNLLDTRRSGVWMIEKDGKEVQSFKLTVLVDAKAWFNIKTALQQQPKGEPNKIDGPDTLTIRTNDPIPMEIGLGGDAGGTRVRVTSSKMEQHFQTIFFPDPEKMAVDCLVAGHVSSFRLGGIQPDAWAEISGEINARNKAAGYSPYDDILELPALSTEPIKASWATIVKTPGRLFDTPRMADKEGTLDLIPEWYRMTAFTRTVGMAAIALTDIRSRNSILEWQKASVDDVADLVYCRGDEGAAPAHGQHREDIFRAFEALRAGGIPIVKTEWRQVGSGRSTRWVKDLHLRVGSFFQSYGAIFEERHTGKRVTADDPHHRKAAVKPKDDRKKKTKDLVRESPDARYLRAFPPDRYKLVGFEWRWNTDLAEDLICPQVALDDKDRPRRMLKGGRHHAGLRFVNITVDYFKVQKTFRDAGMTYAPRLLDFIVSEFKPTMRRVDGAVLVEIAADKVIKYVGAWDRYQSHPKEVVDAVMTPAVEALINAGVILSKSDVTPRTDRNPERRKAPFYRWRVAEKWTAVQMVPDAEVSSVEDAIVAAAEAEDADQLAPPAVHQAKVQVDQPHLPGMDAPAVDSTLTADAIKSARIAAGMTLRGWQKAVADGLPAGIKAPSHFTWHMIEGGQRGDLTFRRMAPEVVAKVKELVARNRPEGTS